MFVYLGSFLAPKAARSPHRELLLHRHSLSAHGVQVLISDDVVDTTDFLEISGALVNKQNIVELVNH